MSHRGEPGVSTHNLSEFISEMTPSFSDVQEINSAEVGPLRASQSQTEISRPSRNSDLGEVSATLVTLQRAYIKNIVFLLTPSVRRQKKQR